MTHLMGAGGVRLNEQKHVYGHSDLLHQQMLGRSIINNQMKFSFSFFSKHMVLQVSQIFFNFLANSQCQQLAHRAIEKNFALCGFFCIFAFDLVSLYGLGGSKVHLLPRWFLSLSKD